ncbi:hypothetical protein F2Q70_00041420 [Brassica cretica]|uniref:NET2A-D/KIP1-like C-terminal domain-containing protein n=1 Tax=Brassica cretica TaxID=69181 RepID=A0A8S9K136_BRACR|nr:hypothetical protein F2Q70_00041420 [Brassica cretica]
MCVISRHVLVGSGVQGYLDKKEASFWSVQQQKSSHTYLIKTCLVSSYEAFACLNIFSVKESVLLDNVLEKQTSSKESDITFNSEQKEGEPDWKEMFTKGMENREKHLLTELNIEELLEENLDFWLRFSTAFGQIQSYDTSIEDLQGEISKLDGSITAVRSDVRPLYLHLREINTDLGLWLEKSAALKEELKARFESLCNIQEEITKALKSSAEDDDFRFTSYQAAKFQGEVLNMKQENNKVADELQAGLDRITALQMEVGRILGKVNDEFDLSGSKKGSDPGGLRHSDSRSRVCH